MSTENFILALLFLVVPIVCFVIPIVLNTTGNSTPVGDQATTTAPATTTKPSRKEPVQIDAPVGDIKPTAAPTYRQRSSASISTPAPVPSFSQSSSQTTSPSPSPTSTVKVSSPAASSATASMEPSATASTTVTTESQPPLTETP